MVAVKGSVDTYLKAPPKGICAILFHGNDAGLISERAAALAKSLAALSNPPGEILRIDDADFETDPDKLAIELGTIPMFGGRKIIRTQQSRKVNSALLKPLIEGPPLEGFLVVEAGSLRADEGLRKLFEAAQNTAAIACYADEGASLDGLVREVLGAHKLDITPDAKRMLIARLGADRGTSRAEIAKLALYALGQKQVEEADVEAIVGDASEMAIDRIVTAAVTGQASAALVECDKALAAGESAQYVLIAAERQIHRLHRVRMVMDAGASLDEALKGLRPPLFYKQRDGFVRQVETWSQPKLSRALSRITDAQRLMRAGGPLGVLDEAAVTQGVLLDLARLAAFKGRA